MSRCPSAPSTSSRSSWAWRPSAGPADAVDLLKTELHDEAEAEQLRGRSRHSGPGWTRSPTYAPTATHRAQAKRATDRIAERLGAIERREQDTERLRVFDGIPLGTREVADAVSRLSPDRLRAVLDVLMPVTVMPVGKGGHVFNPERVQVNWR